MSINFRGKSFFDRHWVHAATTAGERKFLGRAGGTVRLVAKRLIRPSRQKTLAQMTERERQKYRIRLYYWRKEGQKGPRPKRPFLASRPGESPRTPTGLLRKHIYYEMDLQEHNVAVGPTRFPGSSTWQVPAVMEYGGEAQAQDEPKRIYARPYMHPARDIVAPRLPEMWRAAYQDAPMPAGSPIQDVFA